MSVVVIGKNSFLASHLKLHPDCADWQFLTHSDIETNLGAISKASVLINFSFSPELMKEEYNPALDVDTKLAGMISADTHYIMLSSRMVYGDSQSDRIFFKETDSCNPQSPYGRNKLRIELSLRENIPEDKLTILRLSNVFGYEPGRHTFFGMALKNLKSYKKMTFNLAPETLRDFLPARIFANWLVQIAKSPVHGTYNLGSGIGMSCQDIANTLVKAYGEGDVIFTDTLHRGEFYLNTTKAGNVYGFPVLEADTIRDACRECARLLRQDS